MGADGWHGHAGGRFRPTLPQTGAATPVGCVDDITQPDAPAEKQSTMAGTHGRQLLPTHPQTDGQTRCRKSDGGRSRSLRQPGRGGTRTDRTGIVGSSTDGAAYVEPKQTGPERRSTTAGTARKRRDLKRQNRNRRKSRQCRRIRTAGRRRTIKIFYRRLRGAE